MRTEIPLVLYSSPRPGYDFGRNAKVPRRTVDVWLRGVQTEGIASVLCLLSDDQLRLYASLPGGLLEYYRAKGGLKVGHVPVKDHATPPLSAVQVAEVEKAFTELPKPVLIHCSAGLDRTGQAVEHLKSRLKEPKEPAQ